MTRKTVATILLVLTTLAILVVTTVPNTYARGKLYWLNVIPLRSVRALLRCVFEPCDRPLRWVLFGLVENVINLALFLPFGALTSFALRPERRGVWSRVLISCAGGLALSVGIEMVQFVLSSRTTDIDDVIFNSLGALSGALLGQLCAVVLRYLRSNRPEGPNFPENTLRNC
jgi:glycopeptide antibiotics resistance protein